MANTTFTGPVISTNGFQATPIALTDASVTLTRLANGGRVNVIPAVSANRTITLPTPVAGTVSHLFMVVLQKKLKMLFLTQVQTLISLLVAFST
jgi:hypothetical protein